MTVYSSCASGTAAIAVSIGYSIPYTVVSTAVMCGYGYGQMSREKNSIECLAKRAESSQAAAVARKNV